MRWRSPVLDDRALLLAVAMSEDLDELDEPAPLPETIPGQRVCELHRAPSLAFCCELGLNLGQGSGGVFGVPGSDVCQEGSQVLGIIGRFFSYRGIL